MEKIDRILNQIYGSNKSAMTFYLILGVIALFFIVLIIITLRSSKKDSKGKDTPKDQTPELKETKEESTLKPQEENKPLSETQVFNNILMGKEEEKPVTEELSQPQNSVYLDRPVEQPVEETKVIETPVVEEPAIEETPIETPTIETPVETLEESKQEETKVFEDTPIPTEDKVEDQPNIQEDEFVDINSIDPNTLDKEPQDELQDFFAEEKSEPEVEEEKPVLESAKVDEISGPIPVKEGFTIEIPKVKPMEIDDYLNQKEATEEEKMEQTIVNLSNDEIKDRLAKLKQKNDKESTTNSELEDLMKNMGLEDTTIIPAITDEEKDILGQ